MIEHRNKEGIKKKTKIAECRAKIEKQNEKNEESVAHTRILKEINVSPKGCNEKCYIAD